jgi:hypothetical protein
LMRIASLEAGVQLQLQLQLKADCLVVGSGCALAVNSTPRRAFESD